MASLLNNASLLLNPAGSIISYQEDKIYSVLPKDGTGDFTFSGGDGGTRVNQQGYIEQTPANLAFQSNAFSTSPWGRQNTTLTSGQSDPLGGTNAWKVEFSAAQAYLYQYTAPITGVVTISAYLRADSTTTIGFNDGAGNPNSVTIGTTWQLYTFTYTVSSVYCIIQFDNYFGVSPANQAKTFYVYGAQLNIGSIAKPYQPTTDRLNYPRITYQNGRGALLSEPQRTNLNTYSQFISSSTYGSTGLTIVYGSTTSPDGTQNASKLVEDTGTGQRYILKNSPFGSYGTYVCSFYAKPDGREWIYFEVGAVYGYANIANGTLGSTGTFDAGWAFNNYGIEPWKDGWYRVWITGTWSSGGAYYAPKIHPAISNGNFVYTGNGVSGIYVYGIQVEAGSYPTSYIPTTSATVTRPKDYTQRNNVTLAPTEATYYADFTLTNGPVGGYNTVVLHYKSAAPAQYNYILYSGGSNLRGLTITNGVVQADIYGGSLVVGRRYKVAYRAKTNDFALFINGIKVGSDTSGNYPDFTSTLPNLYVGNDTSNEQLGQNNTFALFETAYSDAQCQELTTVRSGSGGTISYYGPYTIHTFTGSATFTPSFSGEVEVLVVAGGGGGGARHGGGGGAGGLIYASSYGVSQGTGVTVTIGAGGPGVNPGGLGDCGINGSNSVFGGLTAIGGGGGGSYTNPVPTGGASGGGGGGGLNTTAGGSIVGQGNPGGTGGAVTGGGGGGGAGAAGSNAAGATTGGNGGNGLPYSITGYSTYYAGGGGGGSEPTQANTSGGLGGGGYGDGQDQNGGAGVAYTGGGGGGTRSANVSLIGGTGGSGIVIVRYLT